MARARTLRSGVILAGGRSSRIGTPKALLDLGGEPLLTRVARALLPSCDELLLVAAPPAAQGTELRLGLARVQHAIARRWDALGGRAGRLRPRVRMVRDAHAHLGPVAGLASALAAARGDVAYVAACDVPFLSPALVAALFARAESPAKPDVVLVRWRGYLEPLVAVYRTATMREHYARQLAEHDLRPTKLLDRVRVEVVDEPAVRALDPEGLSFVNLNARADYEAARALLERTARRPLNERRRRPGRSPRGSSAGA